MSRPMAIPFACDCPAPVWMVAGRCARCGGHLPRTSRWMRRCELAGSAVALALMALGMATLAAGAFR